MRALALALSVVLCGCSAGPAEPVDWTTKLTCTAGGRVTFQSDPGRWVMHERGWHDYRHGQGYSPALDESCAARRVRL